MNGRENAWRLKRKEMGKREGFRERKKSCWRGRNFKRKKAKRMILQRRAKRRKGDEEDERRIQEEMEKRNGGRKTVKEKSNEF